MFLIRRLFRKCIIWFIVYDFFFFCGLLVRFWNMYFEGKYKDFKKMVKNVSFKNLIFFLLKVSKDL